MPRPIFSEITADRFTVICEDTPLIFNPAFKSAVERLIDSLWSMSQDGQPVFRDIVHSTGAIDLQLNRETPLRDIRILHNRIEQMMQNILSQTLDREA